MPHFLRRTKKEILMSKRPKEVKSEFDSEIAGGSSILGPQNADHQSAAQEMLSLPPKDEQVVLCPLTLAQYQIYADFLSSHNVEADVTKSVVRTFGRKRKGVFREDWRSRSLWYISVLGKICNHPDLLLLNLDPERWPSDFGSVSRSGKMKVLMQVLNTWVKESKQKVLIFSQTIQTLDIIDGAVGAAGYHVTRLDGRTPLVDRLPLVHQFNTDPNCQLLLLTTRVGGVGLNLVGASRVIVFDPDWNPAVDSQAQERVWRIGQGSKSVVVYRLICKGTLEEKVYKRQIFKHFLAEKILADSLVQKVFKAQDFLVSHWPEPQIVHRYTLTLQDLFAYPPVPRELRNGDVSLPVRLTSLFTKSAARETHSLKESKIDLAAVLQERVRAGKQKVPNDPVKEAVVTDKLSAEEGEVASEESSESDSDGKEKQSDEAESNLLKALCASHDIDVSVVPLTRGSTN